MIRPYAEIHQGQGSFELPAGLTLQLLLEHCEQWIENVDINKEMPPLSFYVSGANGKQAGGEDLALQLCLVQTHGCRGDEPMTKLMRTFHP